MADDITMGAPSQGEQAQGTPGQGTGQKITTVLPNFQDFTKDMAGYMSGAKTPPPMDAEPAQAQGTGVQPAAQPGEGDSILGAEAETAQEPVAQGPQAGAPEEPAAGAAEGPQAEAGAKKEEEAGEAPASGPGLL